MFNVYNSLIKIKEYDLVIFFFSYIFFKIIWFFLFKKLIIKYYIITIFINI